MTLRYAIFFGYAPKSHWRCYLRRLLFTWLAFLIVSPVLGCEKHKATNPEGEHPAEVTVATITPQDTPVAFEYVARVESSRQVNIQARVNGFLDKRVYTRVNS